MSKREPRKRAHDSTNEAAAPGGNDSEPPQQQIMPIINKRYMVEKFIINTVKKVVAVIIHIDFRKPPQEVRTNNYKSIENHEQGAKELMYYVHYEELDRRNDEWITLDKILVNEVVVEPVIKVPTKAPVEDLHKEIVVGPPVIKPSGALTRSQRRTLEEYSHLKTDLNDLDATTARLEREHEERTKVKNIPQITIGAHEILAWYYSPFPPDCENLDIYMCEYCLLYTPHHERFKQHIDTCKVRQPPGNEIYRKDHLSVYEVDGSGQKLYCQCLCLLSKLFMDHKTLYFDVDDFMFYVLCETDEHGAHIVGYFSREVESANNLACIMVFPPFQKKGYGKLLIQFSYELSRREGYIGMPEKPLSDLGKVSYRSYWWWRLMKLFHIHQGHTVTATFLSNESGIAVDDIVSTLITMRMCRQYKEPEFIPGEWYVRIHRKIVDHCVMCGYGKPPRLLLDRTKVRWAPAQTRPEFERQQQRTAAAMTSRRASKSQNVTPLVTPLATPPIEQKPEDTYTPSPLTDHHVATDAPDHISLPLN
ncbi:Histone acetyltransferase [Caenorhabditis elegans]|uniref:Histone acetyltransferase n=2 Tax=Caenorhabditis elegans TaxID=6239 RepID=A0A131MAV3_CAEEL|nr:Histone acetyltransferase [Caenorhabditis elegans]CZR14444.1 Histone acetyltransferase [Caenorhabditis elegans]|eukprot:NP_001309531.1 Histone acetyltransferase [Caenorhabditis elegans]